MSYRYFDVFGYYNKCYCDEQSCFPGEENELDCQFIFRGEWLL